MCVNNLSKVALDSAAAGNEPATSSRKCNALTTAPPRWEGGTYKGHSGNRHLKGTVRDIRHHHRRHIKHFNVA